MVTSSPPAAGRVPRGARRPGTAHMADVPYRARSYCRGMPVATALVGRDAELARLVEWVEDLVSGTGRAILIEGQPGIGKSSLARAAAAAAERRGCRVYRAAADE